MSRRVEQELLQRLRKQIDYVSAEFDITYAQAIGCLELLKITLLNEISEEEDKDTL